MGDHPVAFAARAPLRRAAVKQKMIVRHLIEIGARLIHRADLLGP
jgi:hypothetical protein